MKNQTIRNAYDSINPSEVRKDQLRQKILAHCPAEEQQMEGRYSAQLYRPSLWGTICAAAACLMVILTGAVILGNMREPAPVQSTPSLPVATTETTAQEEEPTLSIAEPIIEPAETTEPSEAVEPIGPDKDSPFGPGSYLDYVTWIRYRNNTQEPYRTRDNSAWYVYYDLNDDGIRDLLIGDQEGWIAEAITCIDGELSLLFGVGCDFRVCDNGAIVTGREEDTHFVIYRMSGTEHIITATIWYDEEAEQWYRYTSLADQKDTITEADAKAILDSYVSVELTMRELSCFQAD